MTKQKIYYKCVRVHNTQLTSYVISSRNSFCVQYKLDKWIYPSVSGTKLFVFETLEDAKNFTRHGYSFAIFECNVINPQNKYSIFHCSKYNFVNLTIVEGMLRLRKQRKKFTHLQIGDMPKNTVVCDAIKLTKGII